MRLSKADVEFYHADRVMKTALQIATCDSTAWEKLNFGKKQQYLDQAVEMVQMELIEKSHRNEKWD